MPALALPIGIARALVRIAAPLTLSPRLSPTAQRRRSELITRLLVPPPGTQVMQESLGAVRCERVAVPGSAGDGALLYLHGGGYITGSPRTHRAVAAGLVAHLGVPAYVLDYRLAPEHPHPAALEDAICAYRALLDRGISPGRIAVAGDSAGGGLALALAMALRDAGDRLPAVVGMICPWLDLVPDCEGTRSRVPREPIVTPELAASYASAYVGDGNPAQASVSPLHGDLRGLPPLVLSSASDDPLANDAQALAERADAEGLELEHQRVEDLWHDVHVLARVLPAAAEALAAIARSMRARLAPSPPALRVGIIGAGMSGICMANQLKQAGLDDFIIYEKAREVGGTWRENRYPGLTCDVPSRFYSYSFAPNPDWSCHFSPGPEIQRYFEKVTDELQLRPHIRFGTEITEARWDEGRWTVWTRDGQRDVVDLLVTATGVLHHPNIPAIPGLETFAGAAFHSARWDESVHIPGRRVAVIGTGSTGVQITAALGGVAASLLVLQRTAQWILPVPNMPYSPLARLVLRGLPPLNRVSYRVYQHLLEAILGAAVTRNGLARKVLAALCRANLRLGVPDPELRRRLTPDYEPLCKRLVMSTGFYPALQRDGVELVTEKIDHIEPHGIVTADGRLHPVDVIVLATGFDAHAYVRPMQIVGENGVTLEQAWAQGPRAYRTIALPGFPNLFTLIGPHSPVGNHSLIAVAEAQAGYVMRWIERMRDNALAAVAPTSEATDRYNDELQRALPSTVWASGCKSWYLDAAGNPELWPWSPRRHREMLQAPIPGDFAMRARRGD